MCGGDIEFTPGATYGTCEYCGSKQTLPRLDDDRRANLYDRANHFRRNNEFDKAMGIYEQILNEDTTDAEAYWSLVLCRYGIEYVEDPTTRRRVPTVNRAQFTSVFDDNNYKSALRYADTVQRGLYEEEANAINEIQKGILAISQKEEPFDVFICYKETDRNGRRTPDSVLANDLYHQLTQEGFKVFFSRITLEDKLGQQYEPYIFAALNSAKVMVVLGTRPEYFTAVWVKNEWSRYLALIKQGQKKMLIPAYKDMDPYDLPDEFSHLQAQDMSKLGFMQDLIRGIKKITQADTPKPTVIQEKVVVSGGESNGKIASLLDRGNMALEDGDWEKAMGFFEEVLNNDSKNAQAYLGEALVQEKCSSLEALIQKRKALSQNVNGETLSLKPAKAHIDEMVQQYYILNYVSVSALRDLYQYGLTYHSNVAERQQQYEREQAYWANHRLLSRAEKFAEGELKEELNSRKQALFATLTERLNRAKEEEVKLITALQAAYARHIQSADQKAHALYEQGANRQEKDYLQLKEIAKTSPEPGTLFGTAAKLREMKGYKDSAALADYCETHAKEIQAQQKAEADRLRLAAEKKKKRIAIISSISVAVVIAVIIIVTTVIIPNNNYNAAVALMESGQYEEAYDQLIALNGYRNSAKKADSILPKIKAEKLKKVKVGDYVFYGTYPQNKDGKDSTPIEWLVLAKDGNKVLLLSKYGLDCQPYNTKYESVTWEKCTLRTWLNGTFYNKAFTSEEQKGIVTTNVSNASSQGYSKWSTNGGNDTKDKIFLLSYKEANQYLGVTYDNSSNTKARVSPTEYAIAQGAWTSSSNKTSDGKAAGYWWLRSPGFDQSLAAFVYTDGSLRDRSVSDDDECVRPALWINLESGIF